MVSRRKGHSETWTPFSPHVSNEPSSQTPSPLILENAPREIHPRVNPRSHRGRGGGGRGGGKLAKGDPRRRLAAAFHFVFSSSLSSSTPRPRRLFRRSRVRDGDLRNRAFVRFVPLARAESIGVFRDAQRSPQASASELGKEDASHRRVLLRGEVS